MGMALAPAAPLIDAKPVKQRMSDVLFAPDSVMWRVAEGRLGALASARRRL